MDQFFSTCKICKSKIRVENLIYNLVKCQNCELIFSKKIYPESEIKEVYNNLYNKSDQYSNHLNEFNLLKNKKIVNPGFNKSRILNKMLSLKTSKILEIGSGVGVTGVYLKNKGVDYYGIEIDPETALKSRSLGLEVETGSIENISINKEYFDGVLAFEVIEHIQNLNLCLELIYSTLKEGGVFGFSVPNYEKIKNYPINPHQIRQSPPPVHLNFFTTLSLKKIFEIHSFDLRFITTKKFPYLNFQSKKTYKNIAKALLGKYHGPTIFGIAQKKSHA